MKVQERAYYLWEIAGCPEGRSEEFWLKAEQEQQIINRRTFMQKAFDYISGCSWLAPFA